jgi:hypothetical protein
MLDSYVIKPIWPLLKQMAESDSIIDVYNKSTWGNNTTKYDPVYNVVHNVISPHANHQQRTEGYVKSISDQSRTNVGDTRRNARNCTQSYFKLEYNKSVKNADRVKEGVQRVQCAAGTAHFLDRSTALVSRYGKAARHFGIEKSREVMAKFNNTKARSGERDKDEKAAKLIDNLAATDFTQTTKAEKPGKVEITPPMGEGVPFTELAETKKRMPLVRKELIARGLGTEESLSKEKANDLKKMLKVHELGEWAKLFPDMVLDLNKINYIIPMSAEMKELMTALGGLADLDESDTDI